MGCNDLARIAERARAMSTRADAAAPKSRFGITLVSVARGNAAGTRRGKILRNRQTVKEGTSG